MVTSHNVAYHADDGWFPGLAPGREIPSISAQNLKILIGRRSVEVEVPHHLRPPIISALCGIDGHGRMCIFDV